MTEPRHLPEPPERIGRYDVFPAFARGGMASVHVGRLDGPSGFSRLFAVKRLHPTYARDERYARRLLEEARVAARIRSPYVVPVIEVVHEGDQLCVVMEIVFGVSLADLLSGATERGVPVDPAVAVTILADALRGLHAAHEAAGIDGGPLEIVHRDVSPQNILVGADGVTRVLDFGVARALGREPLTRTGEVHGKIGYMAPEQLRGDVLTRQADVYAVGIVLWETLAGERLRREMDASAVAAGFLEPAPSLAAPDRAIPPELDAIVGEALAADAGRRFATAEAMALALEEACEPATREKVARFLERVADAELERLAAVTRSAETFQPIAAAAEPRAPRAASPPPSRRSLARWPLAAAAVMSVASVTGFVVLTREVPAAPAAIPTTLLEAEPTVAAPVVEIASPPVSASSRAPDVPSAARKARSRPRGVPSAGASRGCTPPYEIDEGGKKHYLPGCL